MGAYQDRMAAAAAAERTTGDQSWEDSREWCINGRIDEDGTAHHTYRGHEYTRIDDTMTRDDGAVYRWVVNNWYRVK